MDCTWEVDTACLPDAQAPADIDRLAAVVDAAVGILWALTGRQYGLCPTIARPCPSPPQATPWWPGGMPGTGWIPILDGGTWRNEPICATGACAPTGPSVVILPGPVHEITEVRVDSDILDPGSYALEGDRLLRATGTWPAQDLTRPAGTPGTWTVTYLRGLPAPPGAARMAGILAAELHAACTGGKCRLPRRATSVQRAGVSFDMPDPSSIIADGYTGIAEIDTWITAHNPHRHTQPPLVLSPDHPGGR